MHKILIIEDDEFLRENMVTFLKYVKFETDKENNVIEFL